MHLNNTNLPNSSASNIAPICVHGSGPDGVLITINPSQIGNLEQNCSVATEGNQLVADQLKTITQTLQAAEGSTLYVALIVGVVSAFAGAFAAFLFSYAQWRITQKREALIAGAKEMLSLVADLEDLATRYWLCAACNLEDSELHTWELKIKNLSKLIARYSSRLKGLPASNDTREITSRIDVLVSQLYDLATGEDFESPARIPSKPIASRIAGRCAEIRGALYQIIHF